MKEKPFHLKTPEDQRKTKRYDSRVDWMAIILIVGIIILAPLIGSLM